MTLFGSIVDWDALLTVVWASIAAGVGVTVAFGLAILGSARATELSREGRPGEAALFGAVGAAGLVAVFAAVVFGIVVVAG
jgi:uncharacterized membrane protein